MKRLILGAALAALTACAQPSTLPKGPMAAGSGITITATPVALNPHDPSQDRIGDFVYAGGLVLSSDQTSRFHGLSDLRVTQDRKLVSMSDEGDLLESRVLLDKTGRLVGVGPGKLTVLTGPDGKPLQGKKEADSEGLAFMPNGDRLVSFEAIDRILLYPAKGGAARVVPSPVDAGFPPNGGMEALAFDPAVGPDGYITAGEDSGATWTCRVTAACVKGPTLEKPPEFGVVAADRLADGKTAWLFRAWDPVRGSRITLKILGPAGEVARMDMAKPLTVDNLEGVSAVPGKDGAIRFYLLSDDNFSNSQKTILLAFDWKPAK
ncbi:esterase-like activity of phytase family protein [Phenylobacterium sp.]|uniref:esterase-like activity of phytase family protein n=1 Tax=Phenylobacterium sp. TaxID=1871053 RepID=UPI0027322F4F|nr:esterase-like activity of phytase family protein [Phenylobacterium sp.]MDP3634260.1 esterase-like activity of phytase family protein [Phenylobacterium sp.]